MQICGLTRCALRTRGYWQVARKGLSSTSSRMASSIRTGSPPAGPYTSQVPGTRANPWEQHRLEPKYPPLAQSITTDVCIVGAGLAGLSTAYRLLQAGKSVVVLESRVRGGGHTGRSLGCLSTWNDDWYTEVEKLAGTGTARLVAQSHADAVDTIASIIKQEDIECGFEQVPGYLVPDTERGDWDRPVSKKRILQELEVCERLEVDSQMNDVPTGVPSQQQTKPRQGLMFRKCANLNPVQFINGLADAVVRQGGQIFEGTRAKGGTVTGPSGGIVETFLGHNITAREGVVLATRSPINRDQLWVHNRQLAKRYYMIGLEVPAGSIANVQLYDTSPSQRVTRLVKGAAGNPDVLLVQGEGHFHGQDSRRYGEPWQALESWARSHFPSSGQLLYTWSSMDLFPADLLGLYGKDPFDFSQPPNYILTGHSGQEWTGAIIGSGVVSDLILNKNNTYTDVYRPSRVFMGVAPTVRYGSELTTYFSTVGWALLKHLVPRSLTDVKGMFLPSSVEQQLQPGQGTVAQHGWRKKALYRDDEGNLHIKSALCTHLGCCVEWNPLDRTFDCPCHGSEFDACGRCIHAPAVADLEDLGTVVATRMMTQQQRAARTHAVVDDVKQD